MKITAFCLFSKTWISLLSLLRRCLQLNQLQTLKGLRHEYIYLSGTNFAVFAIFQLKNREQKSVRYENQRNSHPWSDTENNYNIYKNADKLLAG